MEIVKFSDIVTRVNTKEDRFDTDKIYYVGGDHIETSELMVRQRGIIKGSTIGPMFYCGFKSGDILFVTRNPHLRKCAIVDFDGICSEKTFVLATKDSSRLLQEYLALVMQSDDFWTYCDENKSGGVNFFLNWSTLANYEFALPSLSEQKVLADKLWAAYRLKESYKKLLAATDDMLKAKFQEMFGDVSKNDKCWNICEMGNIADIYQPKTIAKKDFVEKGKYSVYGANGVIGRYDKFNHESAELIIGCRGTCGVVNVSEPYSWINGNAMVIHIKDDRIIFDFLKFILSSINWNPIINGAVQPQITRQSISPIKVPLPPLPLQQEFVAIATQAEATKESLRKSIENIDQVIKSLINQ